MKEYDCIVIGAGHAGIEAALAPARMGVKTLMVNFSFDTIGLMSCNPAIGGIGKGQLVREVDILGGEMGLAADRTGIQFRQLNASKGAAVRSSRCQADRERYRLYMQDVIRRQPDLTFFAGEAAEILVKNNRVTGLRMVDGTVFESPHVIVTAGTFLNGRIHLGPKITPGGRVDEKPSVELAQSIQNLGFVIRNFKTGTPARLDGRTIDYSRMARQDSDMPPVPFSYRTPAIPPEQKLVPCWLTSTTEETHKIIRDNFHLSPMYSGQIDATGVRYCPSIEDKLKKFSDRPMHHVFLEPDGLDTPIVYPNGISTGLPENVQEAFVRTIPGLEQVKFIRYGYSIEHGVIFAEELKGSLESKRIEGLFFAGQVNGTTGYEEAAVQGIMAGINAGLKVKNAPPFILGRDEAYAGVLMDDLITKGTNEPYRMFTSRVEYRLIVREDNTDLRLAHHARRLGLMADEDFKKIEQKYEDVKRGIGKLKSMRVPLKELNPVLESAGSAASVTGANLYDVLKRPRVSFDMIAKIPSVAGELSGVLPSVRWHIEYDVKYEGFIDRQKKEVEKFRHLENIKIPDGFDFMSISSISHEVRQKLTHFKPATLGQANRISGVTPAAISVLMICLRKHSHLSKDKEGG
ncbi:MAG: tRNA uridine-5-carboxymethylaminomethyl(34) synthesis enzyme MnmG [Candidatus Omnitrophica bacterium]|nr:tRNA uridine-5-carboxymethylaminomethyl(34) synthesis enzyme MnmG [Candidatus Omnitrophota bacterium]